MKPALVSIFIFLFAITPSNAQTKEGKTLDAVSFELGKTGVIFNLNFDHRLISKNFGFRVGAGSNFDRYLNVLAIGGGGYYIIGNKNDFLELGFEVHYLRVDEVSDDQKTFLSIFVYPNYTTDIFYPSVNIGYRRYAEKAIFRAGVSPGLIDSKFFPGGYLSIGFRL